MDSNYCKCSALPCSNCWCCSVLYCSNYCCCSLLYCCSYCTLYFGLAFVRAGLITNLTGSDADVPSGSCFLPPCRSSRMTAANAVPTTSTWFLYFLCSVCISQPVSFSTFRNMYLYMCGSEIGIKVSIRWGCGFFSTCKRSHIQLSLHKSKCTKTIYYLLVEHVI